MLAASLGWLLLSSGDAGTCIAKKKAQGLFSGTVKAMGLNPMRSWDLDWLNPEFNDSEYQGDG